jgi:hypothetical protein
MAAMSLSGPPAGRTPDSGSGHRCRSRPSARSRRRGTPRPSRPSATTPSAATVPTACSHRGAACGLRLDQPVPIQTPVDPRPRRHVPDQLPHARAHGPAGTGSGPDPTPDAPGAASTPAPPPPAASDADTNPDETTGPPDCHPALAGIAAQPRVHRLSGHPEPAGDLRHRGALQHPNTARYRCSTTASSTNIRGPPSRSDTTKESAVSASASGQVSRRNRTHCRAGPEQASRNCHPPTETQVSSINRRRTRRPRDRSVTMTPSETTVRRRLEHVAAGEGVCARRESNPQPAD